MSELANERELSRGESPLPLRSPALLQSFFAYSPIRLFVHSYLLILSGLFIAAACYEIVRIGDLRTTLAAFMIGDRPVTLLVFWLPYLAAFLPYMVAAYRVCARTDASGAATGRWDKQVLAVVLLFAVVFRALLWFSPPTLSDDVFRYVWDGKMQNTGINPYRYPPDALEIALHRDAYYPGINNKSVPTIYPPLMQFAFRLTDRIAHTPYAMKTFFVLCDLAVISVILLLLRTYGQPLSRVLIYAWNPLVLVEVAGSGHNDPLALVLMLAAVWAIIQGRHTLSILFLALSFAAKFFSVVLIPVFFKTIRRVGPFLLFPAMVAASYLPFLDAGERLFHGLFVYTDKWRFNDSLFTLILAATGSLTHAKIVIAGLFLVVVAAMLLGNRPHIRVAYLLVGAYLILTPTLQPWYLIWIIPFLCFYPNRAWILLTGLVMASYHVLIQFTQTGLWKEAFWIRYVQFVPFYALLVYDAVKRKYPLSR